MKYWAVMRLNMAIILLLSVCCANDELLGKEQMGELGLVSYYCINGVVYMKIDHEKNTTFTPIVKNNKSSIQPFMSCGDYILDKKRRKRINNGNNQ